MERPLNRIVPRLGPGNFKTYQILAPKSTHFRKATCEEFGCDAMANGWKTVVDETSEIGMAQALYIRKHSGRKFREDRGVVDNLTIFIFVAGQRCFREHMLRLDRPEVFLVKDGDHRGNPRGTEPRRHVRASDWVEDFAEHQDGIAQKIKEG